MLSDLCQVIAKDIENCGNLCDKYSRTSFLGNEDILTIFFGLLNVVFIGQLFKSPIYDQRFSDFIDTFETRKNELDHKMLLLTTIRVHSASEGISRVQEKVKSTEEHIKTLILLQRLHSPLEQKVLTFIHDHHGADACLADEKIMDELISMTQGYSHFLLLD
jgi:hypothetical protein